MDIRDKLVRIIGHNTPEIIYRRLKRRMQPESVPGSLPKVLETKISGFSLRIKYMPHCAYIGPDIYYTGIFEGELLRLTKKLLRPGMSFIDIGANCGLFSLVAADAVGASGKVYAFEPQQELANLLQESMRLNALNNISCFQCALSNEGGSFDLYFPSKINKGEASLRLNEGETTEFVPIPVKVDVLSDVCMDDFSNVDFGIKIDVEGAECNVFEGAKRLFHENKPEFILFECIDRYLNRFGKTAEDLFELLYHWGYELFAYREARMRRWQPDSFVRMSDNVTKYKNVQQFLAVHPDSATWKHVQRDKIVC